MTLDTMNMETFRGGYRGYSSSSNRNKKRPGAGIKPKNKNKKNKKSKKGGSLVADVSVPASLLLLNQFFKKRNNESKKIKRNKRNKKNKTRKPKK